MTLLTEITVSNFRCFRRTTTLPLGRATYLVGVNNAGKTAFLSALQCFFDSDAYSSDFLNKTQRAARGRGANRSIIAILFNLDAIAGKTFRKQLTAKYGSQLAIVKIFTTAEISRETTVYFRIGSTGPLLLPEDLPVDLKKLLKAVSVSYIHPQEGGELLRKAQEKLKARLFQNWGRHVTVANRLKTVQESWDKLRATANNYLSSSLTENVRSIWPHSSVKVDLPSSIEDVVAISDILFQGSKTLPDIPLTAQGAGAQSTVLYHAHYLLDSDRSLHRGPYSPVWLLEEPESFLHADLAMNLGALLNSDAWLANIQMIVSTHSPHILATSKANEADIVWALLSDHAVTKAKVVNQWTFAEIKEMGEAMGDTNFDAYFYASGRQELLFLEDSRPSTKAKFVAAGFAVERALKGIPELRKYVDVFRNLPGLVRAKSFFLVDNDKGKNVIDDLISSPPLATKGQFTLHKVSENTFILLMPAEFASEDLFDEFADVLKNCREQLFTADLKPGLTVPGNLSRAHASIRSRRPASDSEAEEMIKNEQDVKDIFWGKADSGDYQIAARHVSAIRALMAAAE